MLTTIDPGAAYQKQTKTSFRYRGNVTSGGTPAVDYCYAYDITGPVKKTITNGREFSVEPASGTNLETDLDWSSFLGVAHLLLNAVFSSSEALNSGA